MRLILTSANDDVMGKCPHDRESSLTIPVLYLSAGLATVTSLAASAREGKVKAAAGRTAHFVLWSCSAPDCSWGRLPLRGDQYLTSPHPELHPPEAGGEGGGHQQAAR